MPHQYGRMEVPRRSACLQKYVRGRGDGWIGGLGGSSGFSIFPCNSATVSADPAAGRENVARSLFPIVSLTDCKSVYDNVHRVGGPKAPSEKRLVVDHHRV